MQAIIDEYDCQSTRPGAPKEKNLDVAFYAGGANNQGKAGKKPNKDVECFNCHKKGHKKANCWAKGGGKEGQGPKAKEKKEKEEPKKALANAAEDKDGVWMAVADMSESEDMVDSEFNDFTISDEDLFFFEDEDEDGNVLDLTT